MCGKGSGMFVTQKSHDAHCIRVESRRHIQQATNKELANLEINAVHS